MNWRLAIPMTAVVLLICLVGSFVTRYSFEQMVFLAPAAVIVVGTTIGVVLFWVKALRGSRE